MSKIFQRYSGMEFSTSEFVCIVNVAFLTLVAGIGFPAVFSNEFGVGTIILEIILLTSAIIFNLAVLIESRCGLENSLNLLSNLQRKIKLLRWDEHWLFKEILDLVNIVSENFSRILQYPENKIPEPVVTNDEKISKDWSKVLSPEIRKKSVDSSDVIKENIKEKVNSEPTRSVSQSKTYRNFLSIKNGNLASKSPELFKNKIYLTRRTLINSQGS